MAEVVAEAVAEAEAEAEAVDIIHLIFISIIIRKYGSTFYIGIAMVVLPYFGPWEN